MSIVEDFVNYNFSSIKEIINTGPLNLEEKYCCIMTAAIATDYEKAKAFLETHKNELIKANLYDLLSLVLSFELNEDHSKVFKNVILSNLTWESKFLNAEVCFCLGYFFMFKKYYSLAEEFFESSIKNYEALDYKCPLWRTRFNIMLIHQLKGQYNYSRDDLLSTIDDLKHLPVPFQQRFSGTLAWYLLFNDEVDLTLKVLSRFELDSKTIPYYCYTEICFNNTPLPKVRRILNKKNESSFSLLFLKITEMISGKDHKEALRELQRVQSSLNYAEYLMLVDIVLELLNQEGEFQLILKLRTYLNIDHINLENIIIPPRNLLWHVAISNMMLKKINASWKVFEKFKINSSEKKILKLTQLLKRIEKECLADTIFLDLEARTISYGEKKRSFHYNSKTPQIIYFLIKNNCVSPLQSLAREIFRDKFNNSSISNLRSLINRIKKSIEIEPFISFDSKDVYLSNKYQWKIEKSTSTNKKNRHKVILELLKSTHLKRLSAKDISRSLGVTPRTITSDLKKLVIEKKVSRLNSGKRTCYCLASSYKR